MKRILAVAMAFAFLILLADHAQAGQVIQFDENGNWSLNGVMQAPATMQTDPISGIATMAIPLGFGNSGDVLVTEPAAPNQPDSDLLRWIGGVLYVFSDQETGEKLNLADVGVPTQLQTSNLTLPETGLFGAPYTENSNGLDYSPSVDQPGGGTNARYIFISDAVPEPTTWILMGLGISIVGIGSRLRDSEAS
jgi:hypothetical protein